MTTWWWPTQSRILVRVAAPSFSIWPTASAEPPVGVDLEVVGVHPDVDLDLRFAVRLGRPVAAR